MIKSGISLSDIKTSTLSRLSLLLNLLIEYAEEEERLIKEAQGD